MTVTRLISMLILVVYYNRSLFSGVLIVFEETPVDKTYEMALETIQSMSKVVDTLYQKAKKLS